MKKILFVFAFVAGFAITASAQSNEKKSDPKASTSTSATPAAEATKVNSNDSGTPAKSCCSSKKGAKAGCADAKAKANCGDKKEETSVEQ